MGELGKPGEKDIAVARAIRTLVKVGKGGNERSDRTPRRRGTPTVGGKDFSKIAQLSGVVLTKLATAITDTLMLDRTVLTSLNTAI